MQTSEFWKCLLYLAGKGVGESKRWEKLKLQLLE